MKTRKDLLAFTRKHPGIVKLQVVEQLEWIGKFVNRRHG